MYFVFTLIFVALISNGYATTPTLLVLSFDHFRPDDIDESHLPYFTELRKNGSGPDYINPIFPLTTFSTHFNIATGVSSDVHGVYNDSVFNSEGTVISRSKELFQINQNIVPIWTENQKAGNGRISGVMMWPGSEYEYHGVTPTYVQPYDTTIEWSARANTIVDWMTKSENKANLVMAHFERSTEFYNNLEEMKNDSNTYHEKIDNTIKQIYEGLKDPLKDTFDLVIFSDHNLQVVTKENILIIEDIVPMDKIINVIVSGALAFVSVKEESYKDVFQDIDNQELANLQYNVYTKLDVEKNYYLDIPSLKNVIILHATGENGFYEKEKYDSKVAKLDNKESFIAEMYGYDMGNKKMVGYLAGVGPKFRKCIQTNDRFNISEIYPMIKFLLELPNEASSDQHNIELDTDVKEILAEHLFPNKEGDQEETEKSDNDEEKKDDDA